MQINTHNSTNSPLPNERLLALMNAAHLVSDGDVDIEVGDGEQTDALLVLVVVDLVKHRADEEARRQVAQTEVQHRRPLRKQQ
jgi:hypothetical protein